MKLPSFDVDGMRLLKRVTMIADRNQVINVHYPVFPSDSDATWVIEQLSQWRKTSDLGKVKHMAIKMMIF